jgi:beta-glucanase (GH16 family)
LAFWPLAGCGGGAPQPAHEATPAPAPAPPPAPSPADFSPPGYQLAFSDEFDGDSLDRTKWCTRHVYAGGPPLQVADDQCTRSGRSGTLDRFNDEQQRYRDFNSLGEPMHVLGGGTLKLRATKTGPAGSVPYEAAMLRSKLDFKPTATSSYYVTAKLKLPNVLGAWPAYWLVGGWGTNDTLQWPPEIDIMEAPLNELDMRANTLGQGSQMRGGLQTASRSYEFTYTAPDYDAQSQIYSPARLLRDVWLEVGALWTATSVCFFVDGVKTACENYNWVDDAGQPANAAHLILNLAVGGAWAGASGIDDAKFPTQVEVDHIRVYRSPGG